MKHVQVKNLKEVFPLRKPLKGTVYIPPDKSISHRAAIISAITNNTVQISNYSSGADCRNTLEILKKLGVSLYFQNENNFILSNNAGLQEPNDYLDAGNSGTTIRLMSGVLAGQDFYSVLTGDDSLKKRPMARIIAPLKEMGANIWARDNDTKAPISIKGSRLSAISYNSSISSAQVKSAVLLAGLFAEGKTSFSEPFKSRDHTERLLTYLGAYISIDGNKVEIQKSELEPKPISIPGDISSAAFFMVAGLIVPDSEILINNVGLNPTRTGIIDVLKEMGAEISILDSRLVCNEEVGDIKVNYSNLKGITIDQEIIPRIIDELPIIAVAATQAEGTTIVKGAEDLRNKESDRIKTTCVELKKLGANIEEKSDGFVISGKTRLQGDALLESYHDHRIAMSGYIAGLVADKPIRINEFDWVNTSFPEFLEMFDKLSL